jgi:multiple sugar transport system substrate-binding protein
MVPISGCPTPPAAPRRTRRALLRLGAVLGGSALGGSLLAACGAASQASTTPSTSATGTATTSVSSALSATPSVATQSAVVATAQTSASSAPTSAPARSATAVPMVAPVPAPRGTLAGTVSLWHDWGTTDGGGLGMLDLIAGFTQTYPQVKVENVSDANNKKFATALASGEPPDMYKVNSPDIPTYSQQNLLTPLDSNIARDKWDMKQYFPFALEQLSWNSKTMAMGHHSDWNILFMNQQVMREVGLDPEKAPTSWGDLLSWGQKMGQKQGDQYTRMGYVPTWVTAVSWPVAYLQANGVPFLSTDGRKATFATQAAANALQWVQQATDELSGGSAAVTAFGKTYQTKLGTSGYGIFPTGRVGMLYAGNYYWDPITKLSPSLQVKNAAFPGGPDAAGKVSIGVGGNGLTIPTGAKHSDLAWEFLKFLGSEEGGYLIQLRTSDVSDNIKAANDPRIVKEHLGRQQVLPLFAQADQLYYLKSPATQDFNTAMSQMGATVLQKKMSAQDALTQANQVVQAALDKYWATQK